MFPEICVFWHLDYFTLADMNLLEQVLCPPFNYHTSVLIRLFPPIFASQWALFILISPTSWNFLWHRHITGDLCILTSMFLCHKWLVPGLLFVHPYTETATWIYYLFIKYVLIKKFKSRLLVISINVKRGPQKDSSAGNVHQLSSQMNCMLFKWLCWRLFHFTEQLKKSTGRLRLYFC